MINQATVLLRPEIAALPPYRQGRATDASGFKLSSNENPFDPLPGVAAAVSRADSFNRYPDATGLALRELLAARVGCAVEEVHLGAGSVSILAQLILAVAGPGDEVVYPWRSFEAYPGLVTVAGASSVQVANDQHHGHDLAGMATAVTDRTRAIIVCTPNNPTGSIVSARDFEAFMAAVPADRLVILDEAYAEFVTDPSAVNGLACVGRYPNLVVLRTFSKAYGLAGLRIGYAVGPETILDAARSTAIPLSVTAAALAGATASLEHEQALLERVDALGLRRDALFEALTAQGWNIPRPHGNFLWLPTGAYTDGIAVRLLDAGIAARPFSGDGIRISVGEEGSIARVTELLGSLEPLIA